MSVLSRQHVQVEFNPGEYYLGDLCYVFTDKQWDELMTKVIDESWGCRDGEFIIDEMKIFIGSTHDGDGTYLDQCGNKYSVDSGTIGICPIDLITPTLLDEIERSELGQILVIERPFRISSDNGIFILNDDSKWYITIDTTEYYEET